MKTILVRRRRPERLDDCVDAESTETKCPEGKVVLYTAKFRGHEFRKQVRRTAVQVAQ